MKTQIKDSDYIKVPELGIKIIPRVLFNGKTYSEILEEVEESCIAPYDLLQKLRNIAFKSGWKKYPFMKNFWVFVRIQINFLKLRAITRGCMRFPLRLT